MEDKSIELNQDEKVQKLLLEAIQLLKEMLEEIQFLKEITVLRR